MIKQIFLALIFVLLASCTMPQEIVPTSTPLPSETATETPRPTDTPAPTLTSTPTLAPTATFTPTFTPTIIPTYAILRGEVLERANCRYGPGAPYLYKYGLVKGSNLEIIGRLDDASWIQIQAIGGNNPCWVKASLMDVKGDPFSIAPVYPDDAPLPVSPYYIPLQLIEVTREMDQVTIRWYGQSLRAGDEEFENAPLYLAEIWACENGEFKFTPYGLWQEKITITDQKGCNETSHGRVYFSEKHGYAGPTEFEFPEFTE
jgi:uncharacterized protein YraI